MKTSELIDDALDWAVAKASGRLGAWRRDESRPGTSVLDIDFDEHGELYEYVPGRRDPYKPWRPSTNWSQGGPIIEREEISTEHKFFPRGWEARNGINAFARGPTPLIAAMRCFCSAKLGDEIDIPEELCQQQNS